MLSRTLVYGVVSALLIGAFAIVDWLVGKVLDQTRLALVADIGVAIALGFWFNALHRTTDELVDRLIFRRRDAAERRLARLASGLPHASSHTMVDGALVFEISEALQLSSAAVFRFSEDERFRRKASFGWPDGAPASLDEREALLLHLQGSQDALRLSEVSWPRDPAPEMPSAAIAAPIVVRHRLAAVIVLGPHTTGEEFDSGEVRLVESCAVAAGAAYDHLEADACEIRSMKCSARSMRCAVRPGHARARAGRAAAGTSET